MNTTPEDRLLAFQNIVALESRNGFEDKAVAGGLDRFLERLRDVGSLHPALRELLDHGMLNVAYRELTLERRAAWAREAERLMGDVPAPVRGRGPRVRTRARPTGPSQAPIGLGSPVTVMRSVSPVSAEKLARLGVTTVRDLLYLFPRRHLDYSQRCTVAQLRPGHEQTVVVSLWEASEVRLGRNGRLRSTQAVVGDETGNILAVWFGQRYLAQTLQRALSVARTHPDEEVKLVLSGKVTAFSGRRQFESPEWEVLEGEEDADLVHTGRLVPVYPATEGLQSQRTLRRMAREALGIVLGQQGHSERQLLQDPLAPALRHRHGLMSLAEAVAQSHYPDNLEIRERARRRLAFDELLVLQLAVASKRAKQAPEGGSIPLHPVAGVLNSFFRSLPFQLTRGQRVTIQEGLADMGSSKKPMTRLLQGEVGSGKTVVALSLLLTAVANGFQGVFMAPTEVLAEQHYLNVANLLSGLAHPAQDTYSFSFYVDPHPRPVTVGLLMGSTPAAPRRELHKRVRDGTLDILIGTHAVIQQDVDVPKLALGVVDEQHRFGVMQRAALRGNGRQTHLLAMTATPIPRTLALTIYGDLEISTLSELPSGRQPIVTKRLRPEQRDWAEAFVISQVEQGRQAFVVCPLIDESEVVQTQAANEEYDRLRTTSLSDLRVGLMHGRLPLKEKQMVMQAFRQGEIDVLVSTPVIEVGIDVPNASVMLIEGADRFGLSQLHQLRGRVGRGTHKSYCLLLAEAPSDEAIQRLDSLVQSNDGFEIAEADLRLRGPGDFFGTRQSGLPTLRMARLSDRDLLAWAREESRRLLASDPELLRQGPLSEAVGKYVHQVVVDEVG